MIFLLLGLGTGCNSNSTLAGHWDYRAVMDDGTTLEGETDATLSQRANQTLIQFSDYSGVVENDHITIQVSEQHEEVQYQVSGVLVADPDKTRLKGTLTIKETHPNGEVVSTRVELTAWR